MRKYYVTHYKRLVLAKDGIVFDNGKFSTENEALQKAVEACDKFTSTTKKQIFLLTEKEFSAVEGKTPPLEEDPDEDLNEEDGEFHVFACEECEAEFATRPQLNGHKAMHTKQRNAVAK